eukprot:1143597-Pelagomonas_calceolata.AAC.5
MHAARLDMRKNGGLQCQALLSLAQHESNNTSVSPSGKKGPTSFFKEKAGVSLRVTRVTRGWPTARESGWDAAAHAKVCADHKTMPGLQQAPTAVAHGSLSKRPHLNEEQ